MDDIMPFTPNMLVKSQIVALEQVQIRALREAILGQAGALARLQAIDNAIAALRAQITKE